MTTTAQARRMFIEYGVRMSETPRRGEFRVGNEKSLTDAVTDFKRVAPMLESCTFGEPTFKEMGRLPEVKEFLSHFAEKKLHFEYAAKINSGRLQKAVILVDENLRPLAAVRWVKGEGKPFFYHGLSDTQFEIGPLLDSIPS